MLNRRCPANIQYQGESIFLLRFTSVILLRFFVLLFSVSTWHSIWNESSFSGTLVSKSCRLLESDMFLVALVLHFVIICIALSFLKRRLNLYVASMNILFGAYIVMALKPPSWYLSFNWKDCYELYDDNNMIARVVMFSYALLTCGVVEIIELLSQMSNVYDAFRCVELRPGLIVSWVHTFTIVIFGVVFYGISLLMWSASYDK